MSGIYGSLQHYPSDIATKKTEQFKYRSPVCQLDTSANEVSAVVDGSIYNLPDNNSLTELYRKHGVQCLHYINGDYAFVIYDPLKNILFGAVDRIGSKPLYYSLNNKFEFSSLLLPLCIGNSYSIDPYARRCYFAMQYIPAPYTIIKEVMKLGAGEYFVYSIADGTFKKEKYWDLYDNTSHYNPPAGFDEAVAFSDSLISDAVEIRMASKGNIPLFLSGGIDSSLVAMYARNFNSSCEAYSVSFQESDWDECMYSSKVAEQLGLKYHKLVFTWQDAMKVIEGLQNYYDEPIGDASAIPTSFLCEQANGSTNMALCGDGGDEVFFGYPRYLRYGKRQWVYNLPKAFRQAGAGIADLSGSKRLALSLRMKDVQTLYLNRRKYFPAENFDALEIQQSIDQCKYLYDNKDARRAMNDFDIKTVLPYELCVKMDRASARALLSTRAPLLDYRLLEYSRLIPTDILYRADLGQKSILRHILYRGLPSELFQRQKRGFGVPINQWFRNGLKSYITDTITSETLKSIPEYDSDKLLIMRDNHINGTADYAPLLWMIANYIEWHRLFKSL